MPPVTGVATYNKKSGAIAVSSDGKVTTFTNTGENKPVRRIDVANITGLKQTPATSAKVSLRVVEQVPGDPEVKNHTFAFSSDDAGRAQSDAIKNILAKAITELKDAASASTPQPANGAGGAPAAMAVAAAANAGGRALANSGSQYDDEKLLANQFLQQELLGADKQLSDTFKGAMFGKPDSISLVAFVRQFWQARIRLLRSFAIQKNQKRGDYNVLSTIKPEKDADEKLLIKVLGEQVMIILRQYPVVRRAKAQLTPRISESEFWTRFFQSRLFKKLKGEKILEWDKNDDLLDAYLDDTFNESERKKSYMETHVPHIIDLEGNEQDNSQKQGNAPGYGDRPQGHDRVPVMRAINSLSRQIMEPVAPNSVDASEPIGMDEATFREMQLRDLGEHSQASRLELHIRDKAKFFATGKGSDETQTKRLYEQQNPADVLKILRSDVSSAKRVRLAAAIGVDNSDSDDDMDDAEATKSHVGSMMSRRKATKQIFDSVKDRRARAGDDLATADEASVAIKLGLSETVYRNLVLAQAAAQVFLNHFWSVYQAGDPDQAGELRGVTEALAKSFEGIKAAGSVAEKEREAEISSTKERHRAHYQRLGVKPPNFDSSGVKGGRKVVDQLMASTGRSIQFALETYKGALEVAQKEAARAQI